MVMSLESLTWNLKKEETQMQKSEYYSDSEFRGAAEEPHWWSARMQLQYAC